MTAKIPPALHEILKGKDDKPVSSFWGALECEGEIGDVYFYYEEINKRGKKIKQTLSYFTLAEGLLTYDHSCKKGVTDTGWDDWFYDTLPELNQISVSVVSGQATSPAWATDVIGLEDFLIPHGKGHKSLERIIGAKFYNTLDGPYYLRSHEMKPDYGFLNKWFRNQGTSRVPKLDNWPITQYDKTLHIKLVQKKRVSLTAPVTIRWDLKIPGILDCNWVHPKVQQLIYWIVTGTLTDGIRRNRIRMSDAGICPHCKSIASTKHMFSDCMLARIVWAEVDQLGHAQFRDYSDFNYSEIPNLLITGYQAISVFKLSAMWVLWLRWLATWNLMMEYGDSICLNSLCADWLDECMAEFKIQLIFRLAEMPAMDHWVKVVQQRALAKQQHRRPLQEELEADSDSEAYEHDPEKFLMPEKEFLLTVAVDVTTNPRSLPPPRDRSIGMNAWIGNQYLWSLNPHNNKLVFNHVVWEQYLREPPPTDPRDAYAPFGDGPGFLELWEF